MYQKIPRPIRPKWDELQVYEQLDSWMNECSTITLASKKFTVI